MKSRLRNYRFLRRITNIQAQERLRITGTGSGTGGMIILAEAFMRTNPDVHVDVLPALGSSGGICALVAHKIDLAVSNREPKDKERALRPLKSFNYARTPVVIAVHKNLGVTSITSDQLAGLYGAGAPNYSNGRRARPVLRMSDATDTRIVRSISPAVAADVDAAATRRGMLDGTTDSNIADLLESTPGAFGPNTLALMGGDEFTALVTNLKKSEVIVALAQRICEVMRQPLVLEGRTVTLTASVGISIYPENGSDSAALLKHADTAMYHAKRSGRDNCQVYEESLTHEIVKRAELERCLRSALDRREFHVVYQPKVDVASGRVLSVEALLRWEHPHLGPISPEEFIPLAEQIGLIAQIGHWVLDTACVQAAIWSRSGMHITVAVNLSPLQICNQDLPQQVFNVLAESALVPDQLELEVTEGALMCNTDQACASLWALNTPHGCG